MIVPQEIRNREFNRALNGYNQEEVVVFLQELSEEYEFLYSQNEKLKDSLRQLRSQTDIFRETEGKLDQVLHLSNHKAAALEEQAEIEAKHLLVHTNQRVNEILALYREVIQRISAFSAETRSLLQEYRDFSEEYSGTEIPGEENGPPEVEQLRVRVEKLLKGLNEDQGTYTPAAGREQVTIGSLMSCLWGETLTETKEEDKVIVPNVIEQTELLIPLTVEPSSPPVQPQVPMEMPLPVTQKELVFKAPNQEVWVPLPVRREGKQKKSVKVRSGWLAILVLAMALGLAGGYCWRHDLGPHFWNQPKEESQSPAGQDIISPLLLAAIDQDADKVEQMLEDGNSPDVANWKGETPLMVAAYQGNSEIARVLLEAGADPNKQEQEWGVTALMHAGFQGNLEVVKVLLEYKADPDISNREGWNALMCAAFAGHPKTAQLLVNEGTDPYLETSDGWTAYELAVFAERVLTAKSLEGAGVKPSTKDDLERKYTANQEMLKLFDNRVEWENGD